MPTTVDRYVMMGPPRAMTDPAVSARAARPGRGSDVLVGMDVGGTAMSAGLVDDDGRVLHHKSQPTHGPGGPLARLLDLAAEMADEARRRGQRVARVGAGVPGIDGLNPDKLLIAGSVGRAFATREADLRSRLARRAYAGALATTHLQFIDLDKDTTVRGGAALVAYHHPAAP